MMLDYGAKLGSILPGREDEKDREISLARLISGDSNDILSLQRKFRRRQELRRRQDYAVVQPTVDEH